jgi:hypothetical protein
MHCRFLIADCRLATLNIPLALEIPIDNLKSAIGNVGTHPLPRVVLTVCHRVGSE